MEELNMEELMDIDGGSNLGNTLITIGGIVITLGSGGTAGVVAGIAVSALGLISGWE